MRGMQPTSETCGTCQSLEASSLSGYGYCRAGVTPEERARFLPRSGACIYPFSRYQEIIHAPAPSR